MAEARQVAVADSFGPVFSHGGFKNWLVCLGMNELVFVHLGIRPSLVGGVAAGLRSVRGVHGAYARDAEAVGERVIELKPKDVVRPLSEISEIYVKRVKVGASELRIVDHAGKTRVFGIGQYEQIALIEAAFQARYPGVFKEKKA